MERQRAKFKLNIPYLLYDETEEESFTNLRFSKWEMRGFTLYPVFENWIHYDMEQPNDYMIIHCHCVIHTEETYKSIRSILPAMEKIRMNFNYNSGIRNVLTGIRFGTYEWEMLSVIQKQKRETYYKKHPVVKFAELPDVFRTLPGCQKLLE